MKFLSPHQPNLQVHGAGRFVDGRIELADADAASISRVRAIAPHWGIQEVESWPETDVDVAELPEQPDVDPGESVSDYIVRTGDLRFDPRGVNLDGDGGVLAHLANADDEERARIIELERQSDRPRKTVLEYGLTLDAHSDEV